jgi:nicotinamidase/pyrazinamidase
VIALGPGDALLIVDVQNDFLAGGALAVPDGEEIVPVLNRWLDEAAARRIPVFATRDWHPPEHCSFRGRGGPWPPHCIQGTKGAEFARSLRLPSSPIIISKGTDPDRDAYSGFHGTDLDARLKALGISRLVVGGLATDYCVRESVREAMARGYQVVLLHDAIRAVDVYPGDGVRAEQDMIRSGAVPA